MLQKEIDINFFKNEKNKSVENSEPKENNDIVLVYLLTIFVVLVICSTPMINYMVDITNQKKELSSNQNLLFKIEETVYKSKIKGANILNINEKLLYVKYVQVESGNLKVMFQAMVEGKEVKLLYERVNEEEDYTVVN